MTSNIPLVSIVIPSYNHGKYLKAAIDSVLAQDYPHLELIVIDDGSTDNSRDILAEYAGRFWWKLQPNQGQVATLNKGWSMSHGDVLGYLSADDLLLPGAVSAAVHCLEQNPDAVLTYCDFYLIDPYSKQIRRVTTPEFDYREMVTKIVCPPGPGALFRRSAFEKTGQWNADFSQLLDFEYWLRLGLQGRFARIPKILAAYRVHAGSQTFAATDQIRPDEPINVIMRYFERNDIPADLRACRQQALSSAHLLSAQQCFRIGRYRKAFSGIYQALALYPKNVISLRAARMLANAIFNRFGHKLLWTLRRAVHAAPTAGNSAARAKI